MSHHASHYVMSGVILFSISPLRNDYVIGYALRNHRIIVTQQHNWWCHKSIKVFQCCDYRYDYVIDDSSQFHYLTLWVTQMHESPRMSYEINILEFSTDSKCMRSIWLRNVVDMSHFGHNPTIRSHCVIVQVTHSG